MKKSIFLSILILTFLSVGCTQSELNLSNNLDNIHLNTSVFEHTNQILNSTTGLQVYEPQFTSTPHNVFDYFSTRDFDCTYENYSLINLTNQTTDAKNVEIGENYIRINSAGIYLLSGDCDDIQIVINCSKEDKVQIILDNVTMTHSTSPIFNIAQADKVFITMAENSINHLSSAITTVGTDDAVIFSREDLTLNGNGTLYISGINANGITSKDDLQMTSGTYYIEADKYGLEANDYIKIADGVFHIDSLKDAIRTKSTEDLAHIYIQNGEFYITTLEDGIDSKGDLLIENGIFYIDSYKDGIRATNDLTINDGIFEINVRKDAIKSEHIIQIFDGDFYISDCHEGIESQIVEIHGGNFLIIAQDDGINCSYSNILDKSEDCYIKITGGTIIIDSIYEADGIDSNHDLIISGGNIIISSNIEDDINAFIDYERIGQITGGTILATSSLGYNNQNFDETSTQCSIMVLLEEVQSGEWSLLNEQSETIINLTPLKAYQSILVSSPEIKLGENYTLITPFETFDIYMEDYIFGDSVSELQEIFYTPEETEGIFTANVISVDNDTAFLEIVQCISGEDLGDTTYVTLNGNQMLEGEFVIVYYKTLAVHNINEIIVIATRE